MTAVPLPEVVLWDTFLTFGLRFRGSRGGGVLIKTHWVMTHFPWPKQPHSLLFGVCFDIHYIVFASTHLTKFPPTRLIFLVQSKLTTKHHMGSVLYATVCTAFLYIVTHTGAWFSFRTCDIVALVSITYQLHI